MIVNSDHGQPNHSVPGCCVCPTHRPGDRQIQSPSPAPRSSRARRELSPGPAGPSFSIIERVQKPIPGRRSPRPCQQKYGTRTHNPTHHPTTHPPKAATIDTGRTSPPAPHAAVPRSPAIDNSPPPRVARSLPPFIPSAGEGMGRQHMARAATSTRPVPQFFCRASADARAILEPDRGAPPGSMPGQRPRHPSGLRCCREWVWGCYSLSPENPACINEWGVAG